MRPRRRSWSTRVGRRKGANLLNIRWASTPPGVLPLQMGRRRRGKMGTWAARRRRRRAGPTGRSTDATWCPPPAAGMQRRESPPAPPGRHVCADHRASCNVTGPERFAQGAEEAATAQQGGRDGRAGPSQARGARACGQGPGNRYGCGGPRWRLLTRRPFQLNSSPPASGGLLGSDDELEEEKGARRQGRDKARRSKGSSSDGEEEGEKGAAWRALGLSDSLSKHLASLGFVEPTGVQRAAVPKMLTGRDCLINAPTGSGKTLSYLAPIIQVSKARHQLPGFRAPSSGHCRTRCGSLPLNPTRLLTPVRDCRVGSIGARATDLPGGGHLRPDRQPHPRAIHPDLGRADHAATPLPLAGGRQHHGRRKQARASQALLQVVLV